MWGCNVLSASVNNVGMILMEPEHGGGWGRWTGQGIFFLANKNKAKHTLKTSKTKQTKNKFWVPDDSVGFAMTSTGAKRCLDKVK